jgi:hypothetical protein
MPKNVDRRDAERANKVGRVVGHSLRRPNSSSSSSCASVIEVAILWYIPETAELRPGALASLRPRVRVPPTARSTFASITPVNIAAWALGGFYFSLMPAVVRVATRGRPSPSLAASW